MRTLVHHPGALGDALLSLSCLRVIRKDSSLIHLIGRSDVATFLREAGIVDEASSSDDMLYASLYGHPDDRSRRFLERFDRAYLFTADDASSPAGIETVISNVRIIRTIPDNAMPVSAFRLMQFPQQYHEEAASSVLKLPRETLDAAAALLRHHGWTAGKTLLAIHPGSGSPSKCWPLKNYLALAEMIMKDRGVFVLFLSGPAESPETTQALDRFVCDHSRSVHAASLKLIDAAALLSHCSLYLGNDSGMTHLAAALGRPVIALFGPTDPALWKPAYGPVEIISAGSSCAIENISLDEVYTRTTSLFEIR